jgi:hypothetical protein
MALCYDPAEKKDQKTRLATVPAASRGGENRL